MTSIGSCGRLGRALATVALALAFLVLAIPEGLAQDQNTIRACVQKSSQQVRIIGPADSCRQTESLVVWNIQGLKG